MNVIIPAAGIGERWKMHLGVRKHLAPVGGQPILHRLVGQFNAAGVEPVILCHPDHVYDVDGSTSETVVPDLSCTIHKIESSEPWWSSDDRTLLVFGDVWFTDSGFAKMLPDPGSWAVYGRIGTSRFTKKYHSMYALSFGPSEHELVWDLCQEVRRRAGEFTSSGRLLSLYQCGTSQSFDKFHLRDRGHFVQVNDQTDDVDIPLHYRRLCKALKTKR